MRGLEHHFGDHEDPIVEDRPCCHLLFLDPLLQGATEDQTRRSPKLISREASLILPQERNPYQGMPVSLDTIVNRKISSVPGEA